MAIGSPLNTISHTESTGTNSSLKTEQIGVVIIGRNEGERLKTCVSSAQEYSDKIVYVDSGSSDGSLEWAAQQNVATVALDMSIPFTAARARNEGLWELLKLQPAISYVQFIDGDCELVDGWLKEASSFLDADPSIAVACGRRRERFPDASIYNKLCDIEWNTPIGEAKACGGDALMRADLVRQLGGFREDVIAGEEPELCFRIRSAGFKIWRLDHEMTLHDAAITRFGEWWKRSKRAGYAFFLGNSIHGKSEENYYRKECRSILFWGGFLPFGVLFLALVFGPIGFLAALIFPVQWLRLWVSHQKKIVPAREWALFLTIGKFAEFSGAAKFFFDKIGSRQARIIEYK